MRHRRAPWQVQDKALEARMGPSSRGLGFSFRQSAS